jgi:hypothetical protein
MTAQIDIEALKEMATNRPDDFMLRASDVLKLIGTIAQLQAENARLQEICGAAYQMAGEAGAPVRFLDVLADPLAATREQVDSLLMLSLDEFDKG